jgi:hypothetical protein
VVELYRHPILPYDKCRAILHLPVLETNITNSLVLTKEVCGEISRKTVKLKLVLTTLWTPSRCVNHKINCAYFVEHIKVYFKSKCALTYMFTESGAHIATYLMYRGLFTAEKEAGI